MSLAATRASDGMRPASFLPSIKCSNCGDEIEISAMGDHICGKTPLSPKAAPASLNDAFTLRQLNAQNSKPTEPSPLQFDSPARQMRSRTSTVGSNTSSMSRRPRAPVPQINPDAANRPFLAPQPRSASPISPAASSRSGSSLGSKAPPPMRSMTGPMPRLWDRPQSPELSANLGCAFPPFPFSSDAGSRRPSVSSGRKTPTGSERGSSRTGSRQAGNLTNVPSVELRSPNTDGSENAQIHTPTSGPIEPTNRRPSTNDKSQPDLKSLNRRRPSDITSSTPEEPRPLPSLDYANDSPTLPAFFSSSINETTLKSSGMGATVDDGKRLPPSRPARPTDSLPPDFLDNLRSDSATTLQSAFSLPSTSYKPAERSNTFPTVLSSETPGDTCALSKVSSEPPLCDQERRPPLPRAARSEPSNTPKAFPKRSQSRNEARLDYRMEDAPPVPKPVQLNRSNSSHRPSGSDSSTGSSARSVGGNNSSRNESPVTSASSSIDASSPLKIEPAQYETEMGMRVTGLGVKAQQMPGIRAKQPKEASPRNDASFSPPRHLPNAAEAPPTVPAAGNWPLEAPVDSEMQRTVLPGARYRSKHSNEVPGIQERPALNRSLTAPKVNLSPSAFSSDDYDPYRPESPLPANSGQQQQPPLHTRARSKTSNDAPFAAPDTRANVKPRLPSPQPAKAPPFVQGPPKSLTPSQHPSQAPPIPRAAPRPGLTRRPTSGAKAICRGCSHQIEGKSVKAADGRLTGRWHKSCFVCKTCQQPFTTADFYVINNHPYCEQHYHEKNGSTCAGCHRGIEGQYLETTASGLGGRSERKYHPRCFTCFDCRMVLDDDYFEIGGHVFCERHALAAMRAQPKAGPGRSPGPGGLTPPHGANSLRGERRTTKLMTMG
ncbi:hypothetical protein LTR37_006744 [Vermiconidia calcicola]|uniref:Uncharacterized protein n=1 Tax=Vermiconidia calcicola TaxID=1690605 RepID=A0ACC3NH97_9PEZI|nr:hypothetical protein LTR37_006744 [Vermiconidia calcicola]